MRTQLKPLRIEACSIFCWIDRTNRPRRQRKSNAKSVRMRQAFALALRDGGWLGIPVKHPKSQNNGLRSCFMLCILDLVETKGILMASTCGCSRGEIRTIFAMTSWVYVSNWTVFWCPLAYSQMKGEWLEHRHKYGSMAITYGDVDSFVMRSCRIDYSLPNTSCISKMLSTWNAFV